MTHEPDIVLYQDAASLAQGAANRIAGFIRANAGGIVTVGMAGGSTPAATYAALLTMDVPWDRVYAWVGDERFVPPDDRNNNGTMIRSSLLDHTDATFFPVPWVEGASAHDQARGYEATLIEIMDGDDDGPIPDLLLAGIGDDGHTLSLFPGTEALDVTDRWFTANWVEQKDTWRLTTTYPLAWRARQVYVLVAGPSKAAALAEILHPTGDPLPANRLMGPDANITWLIDAAAASGLGEFV